LQNLLRALRDLESAGISELPDDERATVIGLVKGRIADLKTQLGYDHA
jgi:hypothetical protein